MTIFHLDILAKAEFWAGSVPNSHPRKFMEAGWHVAFILDELPKVLRLLARESESQPLQVREKKDSKKTLAAGRITFLINENDFPSLTTGDLSGVLRSIDDLYAAVLRIYNFEPSELVVGALDSGSEKSFDIIGAGKAIDKLSKLFTECWDRIRYARAEKAKASFKAACEGISLLVDLSNATKNGALATEESEKLRRSIVNNIDKLFSAGVYTLEMELQTPISPSQIQVERRKLITFGADRSTEAEKPLPPHDSDAADEIEN